MQYQQTPYTVYIKTNGQNQITAIQSSEFVKADDLLGWIQIDSGLGDKYHHAQNHYLDHPLMTNGGAYRYAYIDGEVQERSAQDIALDEQAIIDQVVSIPTALDMVEAQTMYTALMTDTLL